LASDDDDEQALKRLTVRELRERAVKSLGSKAAGLKTKQELIDALTAGDSGSAAKGAPRKKKAAPAPKAKAEQAPPLAVVRDFFVDPRKPSLPSAYGDDRLLVFRREPLAVVVSWDLSEESWGDGKGVWLELIEPRGRLVARSDVVLQTGLATFEELPEHVPLVPQIVRRGRVRTRGRAFSLGPLIEDQLRYQMTVLWDQPLPSASEASGAGVSARHAGPARGHVEPGGGSSRVGLDRRPLPASQLSSSRVAGR
jgi:hypothetical protein